MSISKKVILVGHFGVGKTSLIRQFVHQKFSDEYLTTIGVKIDKKLVQVEGVEVNLLIWDIAGETSQQKVPASYRLGAHGILYVFDITRPSSYEKLVEELDYLKELLPGAPLKVLANKKDLMPDEQRLAILSKFTEKITETSAKTGENVEAIFESLTKEMIA